MYLPLVKNKTEARSNIDGKRPCGVLIGEPGAGKTTLYNLLCHSGLSLGATGGSATGHLVKNDVNVGDNAFCLIDTPGTESYSDMYKDALVLRAGLTATQLNTILVVLTYCNRYYKMADNYLQTEQPVSNYTNKIIVLISHMDNADDPQKEFPMICGSLTEACPNIANVIFFSKLSDPSTLADLIYSCMSNMEPEPLEISDADFCFGFNLQAIKSNTGKLLEQYNNQMQARFDGYAKRRDRIQTGSDKDNDKEFHKMTVQFKYDLNDLYREYSIKYKGELSEMEYYAFCIEMQKENAKNSDRLINSVIPLISYNLLDKTDPRNTIKKCPHCGLVWWKADGCDGVVTCGNLVPTLSCDGISTNDLVQMCKVNFTDSSVKLHEVHPATLPVELQVVVASNPFFVREQEPMENPVETGKEVATSDPVPTGELGPTDNPVEISERESTEDPVEARNLAPANNPVEILEVIPTNSPVEMEVDPTDVPVEKRGLDRASDPAEMREEVLMNIPEKKLEVDTTNNPGETREVYTLNNPVETSGSATDPALSASALGCGRPMVWNELPKLDDEVLLQMFEVKTLEEIKNILQWHRPDSSEVVGEHDVEMLDITLNDTSVDASMETSDSDHSGDIVPSIYYLASGSGIVGFY